LKESHEIGLTIWWHVSVPRHTGVGKHRSKDSAWVIKTRSKKCKQVKLGRRKGTKN